MVMNGSFEKLMLGG